jgi:hypothetical protein
MVFSWYLRGLGGGKSEKLTLMALLVRGVSRKSRHHVIKGNQRFSLVPASSRPSLLLQVDPMVGRPLKQSVNVSRYFDKNINLMEQTKQYISTLPSPLYMWVFSRHTSWLLGQWRGGLDLLSEVAIIYFHTQKLCALIPCRIAYSV